ncbi:MAG TPA: sugar ABC transporter substrate-binding protein [Syntrophales bacterium]|jgi:ribose transport system substrate-binding protein|nr:sugar ABC transporter substrate-binding protein [Syntrophales bacterium]
MKKIAITVATCLLTILVILAAFEACNDDRSAGPHQDRLYMAGRQAQDPQGQPSPSAHRTRVALVMKTLTNPFFIEMEKGARRAEQDLDIELIVKTGAKETSVDQQIAIIEELTEQKIEAIVIAPADSTRLIPALRKAWGKGVVIVNIDNRLDREHARKAGLNNIPFISVDNQRGAYISAKHVSDQITRPTEAAILEGIREADNAVQRKKGALRAFRENPNLSVVAIETANWKIDEAYKVAGQIFRSHPRIGVVFCSNDMMALGVIEYLDEKKRRDVLVAGFDNLSEVQDALRAGKLRVTIDQQAAVQGYEGVRAAVDLLRKKDVPAETLVDVRLITGKDI